MSQNNIKHSGCVHVRGMMIRRWRPRYLELDAFGVLRYYEATEDNNSMTSSNSSKMSRKGNYSTFSDTKNNIAGSKGSIQQQPNKAQSDQNGLKGYGNGDRNSNKDFVHITNDDIMSREMQAFSLPTQFHSLTTTTVNEEEEEEEEDEEHKVESNNLFMITKNTDMNTQKLKENPKLDIQSSVDGGYSDYIHSYESDSLEVVPVDDIDAEQEIVVDEQEVGTKNNANDINSSQHYKSSQEILSENQQHYPLMASQQELKEPLHHHVHKHRAKAVMTILSARVIDVSSLRDIHVGLPKGTHGFVFTGRQLFSNSDNNNATMHYNNMIPDNDDDVRDDLCHPLSILSSDHDYFDTSRDYLCSVNTLEEAQSWVSALRWAANVASIKAAQHKIYHQRPSCDPYFDDNSLSDDSFVDSLRSIRSPLRRNNYLNGLRRKDNLFETLLIEDDQSLSSDEHCNPMSYPEGIAIVTKVRDVGIKLRSHKRVLGFKIDIKYEVKMLLLLNIQLTNRSRKRKNDLDFGDSKTWTVQERTIYCTMSDLIDLLDNLHTVFSNSNERKQTKIEVRDIIKVARDELSQTASKSILNNHSQVKSTIWSVDKVIRTLASDKILCNVTMVKEFLLKDNNTEVPKHNFFMQSQLSLLIDDNCTSRREYFNIDVGDSIDEFVKKWLFESKGENGYKGIKMIVMMLQNPVVELFVTTFSLYVLYQSYVIWSVYLRHKTSIRIDSLILQGLFMFYCGYKTGNVHRSTIRSQCVEQNLDKTNHQKNSIEKLENPRPFAVVSPTEDVIDVDEAAEALPEEFELSCPLPYHNSQDSRSSSSSWSKPLDNIFKVRGKNYLNDKIKVSSNPSPLTCRGIDMWLTNNPERHIARHPSMLGGKLNEEDTFLVNFLLPFGNFVTYFSIPPISKMPSNVAAVWTKFINGDQQDRDARLKLLPVVVDGPWIVKKAVGHGPALLGQAIPLQYYFTHPTDHKKGIYEVDVIITASRLAKGILNVVKGHTKRLTIALAFIIEAATESELPESVLCSCQLHSLHLELCPSLPKYYLEEASRESYE